MAKFQFIIITFCLIGISFAKPASNEQLDKTYRNVGGYVKTTENGGSLFKENLDTLTYDQRNSIATVNDFAVNAVSEEKKPEVPQQQHHLQQQQQPQQQQAPSTVEISGITTGANPAPANPASPQDHGGFKPQRAGSMFARLIDDIFQIPIAVLQNVARLITNPFTQARKEAAAAAAAS